MNADTKQSRLKPMNILLTGGTGYVGSHSAVELVQAGHQVVIYDNLCNSDASVIERLRTITGQAIPLVIGDVRDQALLSKTLREHGIEAVMHFAGLKAVGESVREPLRYYDNNVNGSLRLLQAMQACNVKTLVFSSSATVYGEPQYLPIDESHPTNPVSPYAKTKLAVEQVLATLCASDPSWRIACLRYFNPVGAHDSGLIGEDPKGIPNNLMPYIARVAVGQLPHLPVLGNDYPTADGTGVRDYIHVCDLAEGHRAALEYLRRNRTIWHPFNLGTGQGISVLALVAAFEAATGQSIPLQIVPRRPGDIAQYWASPIEAKRRMGWSAYRSIEEICSSTWKFASCFSKN